MEYDDMLNKVAKQVKIDPEALSAKADGILAQEGAGWQASGKTEQECKVLSLRVAARQVAADSARLARSGADLYEGMFVSVPRPKDWAGMAYKKMKGTLDSLDTDARMALVTQGAVQIFEDNHDGTFTCHYNPSLEAKQIFEEDVASKDIDSLPKRSMSLTDGSHFSLIWDKNNREFANGNANFKYGSLRPLEELDRTCIFYGRNAAGNGNVGQIEVRLSGEQAKIQFPTFVTGTIGLKTGNKPGLCYGTKATQFNADPSKSDIFGQPPLTDLMSDNGPSGIIADWLGETLLPSLEKCAEVYDTLDQKEKWNTTFATVVEVVHIDPRERGGFVLSLADVDIMSGAPVIDMVVPAEHEGEVDFGIGSELVIIGSPWTTNDGELRFSTSGWWCVNAMTPLADTTDADTETGWDAE